MCDDFENKPYVWLGLWEKKNLIKKVFMGQILDLEILKS